MLRSSLLMSLITLSLGAHAELLTVIKSKIGLGPVSVPETVIQPCTQGYSCVSVGGEQVFMSSLSIKGDGYEVLAIKDDAQRPKLLVKTQILGQEGLVMIDYDRSHQRAKVLAFDPRAGEASLTPLDPAAARVIQHPDLLAYLNATTSAEADAAAARVWAFLSAKDKEPVTWMEMYLPESKAFQIQMDLRELNQQGLYTPAVAAKVVALQAFIDDCARFYGQCNLPASSRAARDLQTLRLKLQTDLAKNGL